MENTNCFGVRAPATPADLELFADIEQNLYTAVVSDSLDELGYRDQAMRENLRPLSSDITFAGWARTINYVDVYHIGPDPYGLEIESVDSILPGEVVVVSTGAVPSTRNAPWGELLSTAAKARGARGAVVDGLVRDVKMIEKLEFPVFAVGIKPIDSKGRGIVNSYNVPALCGGVMVNPGDLIFADFDGIVVIPPKVLADVVRLAKEKTNGEDHSRPELMRSLFARRLPQVRRTLRGAQA